MHMSIYRFPCQMSSICPDSLHMGKISECERAADNTPLGFLIQCHRVAGSGYSNVDNQTRPYPWWI